MLDLSFLLSDPNFCAPFTRIRRTEAVNSKGRVEFTEEAEELSGSIQPATPEEVETLPEAVRTHEALTIYAASGALRDTGPGGEVADAIIYQGKRYAVTAVETWPHYIRAIATLEANDARP